MKPLTATVALLILCVGCAHLSEKPVLVVFETELGNITVEVDTVKKIHQAPTGRSVPYQTETLEPPIKIFKAYREKHSNAQ